MPSHTKALQSDVTLDRMLAVMRLVLATAALLITPFEPVQSMRHGPVYVLLILYITYSAVFLALTRRRAFFSSTTAYFIDVGWYIALMGVGGGASSLVFFVFLIFLAIMVASFQQGLRAGLRVTLISVVLFTLTGLLLWPLEPGLASRRFLLWPVILLVLGSMIAYWGDAELTLKQRLALLKDIGTLANPRFGIDRTLGAALERLRAFYEADSCLLIMADYTTGEYHVRRADRHNPQGAERAEPMPPEMRPIFLAFPADQALLSHGTPHFWQRRGGRAGVQAYDTATGEWVPIPLQVSSILDAESYITVPLRFHGKTLGRLYLTARRRHAFGVSDVDFLLQALEQTMPVIDNIRLVDRLASDAAEIERQRIARDLHDSVIQPYIGLQIGLAAVLRKHAAGATDVRPDLEQLLALSNASITDLRHYVWGLREGGRDEGGLVPAVQRFAHKFTAATDIAVQVNAAADVRVNDRLAAEAFQMVAEGLSNVRRHTDSAWASIALACCNGHFRLCIANDNAAGTAVLPFTPRSLTERAAALGGQAHVERTDSGHVAVVVEIPL